MALDVPARDVRLGDCGFRGSGGGARSGSELSHLMVFVSMFHLAQDGISRAWEGKVYIGMRARPWSNDAEC